MSSTPPHKHKNFLKPFNPEGKQLVRQYILYKWHGYGYRWCQGIITKWNDNPSSIMGSDPAIVKSTLQF